MPAQKKERVAGSSPATRPGTIFAGKQKIARARYTFSDAAAQSARRRVARRTASDEAPVLFAFDERQAEPSNDDLPPRLQRAPATTLDDDNNLLCDKTSWALTNDQEKAERAFYAWWRDRGGKQVFKLDGFAGTGKTTLLAKIGNELNGVKFAAFTGKAARVMREAGCEGAQTIHSLIYWPKEFEYEVVLPNGKTARRTKTEFVLKEPGDRDDPREASLLIIDESSMVGGKLAADLLKFRVPMLVVGDPFQLPPVEDTVGFPGEPDAMLAEVTRQAKESPIIRLAEMIRAEGRVRLNLRELGGVRVVDTISQQDVLAADAVLCGLNKSRHEKNQKIRRLLNFSGPLPQVGERLVCLKNDHLRGFLNGDDFLVKEATRTGVDKYEMSLSPFADDDDTPAALVALSMDQFELLDKEAEDKGFRFGFGYARTVHKAQGSQWKDVVLFNEAAVFEHYETGSGTRWLYTAVTRAVEALTVVEQRRPRSFGGPSFVDLLVNV